MKVSDLNATTMMSFLRLDDSGAVTVAEVTAALNHAVAYVSQYTGIAVDDLDDYADITQAVMIMTQDFYDNRAYQVQKDLNYTNKAVDSILRMHCTNLL